MTRKMKDRKDASADKLVVIIILLNNHSISTLLFHGFPALSTSSSQNSEICDSKFCLLMSVSKHPSPMLPK